MGEYRNNSEIKPFKNLYAGNTFNTIAELPNTAIERARLTFLNLIEAVRNRI